MAGARAAAAASSCVMTRRPGGGAGRGQARPLQQAPRPLAPGTAPRPARVVGVAGVGRGLLPPGAAHHAPLGLQDTRRGTTPGPRGRRGRGRDGDSPAQARQGQPGPPDRPVAGRLPAAAAAAAAPRAGANQRGRHGDSPLGTGQRRGRARSRTSRQVTWPWAVAMPSRSARGEGTCSHRRCLTRPGSAAVRPIAGLSPAVTRARHRAQSMRRLPWRSA